MLILFVRYRAGLTWVVTLVCLLAFWGMALDTAVHKSLTVDEPVHLTRGIALWQGLDLRLQQEHIPLSHWFIGLLSQSEPLPDLSTLDGWAESDRLITAGSLLSTPRVMLNLPRLLWLGRVPLIWLGVLLGALLMRWARAFAPRQSHSPAVAQITAGVLWAFSPNLIAHTAVATTDFTATFGYLIALFTLYWYAQRPTRVRLLAAGLGLGLGLASKITGLLLLPLALTLLFLAHTIQQPNASFSARIRPILRRWLSLLPLAGLVVWSVYRFDIGAFVVPQIGLSMTLPAPDYWGSLWRVITHIDEGHRSFLMGEISSTGWYHYFGVALAIKTSLPVLLLLIPAVGQGRWRERAWLWLPSLLLLGVASYTRLNIGYRHILSILPLLMVWGAAGVAHGLERVNEPQWRMKWQAKWLVAGWIFLLLWQVGGAVRQHPHHLAFFNEVVGGSENGYRYLLDSNLDWGQDLYTAVVYLQQQHIAAKQVFIAPFGFSRANYVNLTGTHLLDERGFGRDIFSAANPAAGHYLLSSNYVQGMLGEPDLFDWFRRQMPVAKLGYTLFAYDVPAPATGSWIAHCADPAPRLDTAVAERLVNSDGIRHVYFDCQQSWVWPQGAMSEPGWYILPHVADWWAVKTFPQQLQLVYEHRATMFAPSYAVYYWSGGTGLTSEPLAQVGDTAVLLDYQQTETTWRTLWQVTAVTEQPLSLLAHLYDQRTDPVPVAVADGLGYSAEQWRPGDQFMQAHVFDVARPALQTGLYNYVTGERLTVAGGTNTAVWLPVTE